MSVGVVISNPSGGFTRVKLAAGESSYVVFVLRGRMRNPVVQILNTKYNIRIK